MSDFQKLSAFNSYSYKTPQIKASQMSVSLVRTAMNIFRSGVEAESFVIIVIHDLFTYLLEIHDSFLIVLFRKLKTF